MLNYGQLSKPTPTKNPLTHTKL